MFGLTPFNRNVAAKTNNELVDFYNMFDDFFNDSFFPMRNLRNDTFKIDVKETDNAFLIEAEIPGVPKEEVKLDYHEGRLLIAVQRDEKINEENENYIHKERRLTSMQTGIYLKNVKSEKIDAKLENGVLKITAPKQEVVENRHQIQIQ